MPTSAGSACVKLRDEQPNPTNAEGLPMKRLLQLLVWLSILAAAALMFAGPGVRLGLWPFPVAFGIMKYAAGGGALVAVIALVLLLIPRARRAGSGRLLVALLLGLGVLALPAWQLRQARSLPPIHDISTDVNDPPVFVAILPLRVAARNPADYGGAEIARQQRAAYPELQALTVNAAVAETFPLALNAARAMGWEIIASDAAAGRIEATATTFWFGFKDDVVIRVRARQVGSVIDVRSLSRIGQSDLGANAARIRQYLRRLRNTMPASSP
jgi:hypothetical protein